MFLAETVKELASDEQIILNVEKAGELYKGCFILFTNSEEFRDADKLESYGIPRVIALNEKVFCESGIYEKYRDRTLYGIPYFCSAYMTEEQIPPVLAF